MATKQKSSKGTPDTQSGCVWTREVDGESMQLHKGFALFMLRGGGQLLVQGVTTWAITEERTHYVLYCTNGRTALVSVSDVFAFEVVPLG